MTAQLAPLGMLNFQEYVIREARWNDPAGLREIARLDSLIPKDWGHNAPISIEERANRDPRAREQSKNA